MNPKHHPGPVRAATGGNEGRTRERAMIRYEIREESGLPVETDLLRRYYGAIWRSIMDRLNHCHDGYLLTIYESNRPLKIYRIVEKGP